MWDQHDIPECLNRRYQVMDQLINELDSMRSRNDSDTEYPEREEEKSTNDYGVNLMCDFWNILKQNSNCDLPNMLQQKMREHPSSAPSEFSHLRSYTCYMARDNKKPPGPPVSPTSDPYPKPGKMMTCCTASEKPASSAPPSVPLTKVLCNLKEAASFDKKCTKRLNELLKSEKQLKEQIEMLENRERAGAKMLKEADCMWSCMEDAYKQKIASSFDRQQELSKQLKVVEASTTKWRKNKKDLESQLDSITKCHLEITDKIHQKTNDLDCMDIEMEGMKKRIADNKINEETIKKSMISKKEASEKRMAEIAKKINEVQISIKEHQEEMKRKENDGTTYVKEAREDLQEISKVLVRKKLENEDLTAATDELISEIKMLEECLSGCKERCKKKQETIINDIKQVDIEIQNLKLKCVRCNQCTDTDDRRKFCTDCPRCLDERDCLYSEDGHCETDHTADCVCQKIKTAFLNNVLENMSTVLAKEVHTKSGKAVAEAVLKCLKYSRNGKLNSETKDILREFILTTVKKNLNLTIVGGAVKTRCELDPETYKQLMLCLTKIAAPKAPPKSDKGTSVKKSSCARWGGTSECFCPKGPKSCVCTKSAPPRVSDPTPCPTDKQDVEESSEVCPYKDKVKCGTDCGMRSLAPLDVDLGQWRPDPCRGSSCPFDKDSNAAHFMLDPTSFTSIHTGSFKTATSVDPSVSVLGNQTLCKCDDAPEQSCVCSEGAKQLKADYDKNCEMDTCDKISCDFETDKENQDVGKIPQQATNLESVKYSINKIMRVPSVQKEVFDKSLVYSATESNDKIYRFDKSLVGKYGQCGKAPNVITEPILKTVAFKVQINGVSTNIIKPPGILKLTTSENYILVLDKEFEKQYQRAMNYSLPENTVCFVELEKVSPSTISINLNVDANNVSLNNHALLVNSSGNIKIFVNGPIFDYLVSEMDKSDSRKAFAELMSISGSSSKEKSKQINENIGSVKSIHSESQMKIVADIKSSSDSQWFQQVRLNLKKREGMWYTPSAMLKRNLSGQLAVVLDKKTKKTLIDDVRNYLENNSRTTIPVKRTDSGEISLNLTGETKELKSSERLKITPSGNIFIVLDDKNLKPMVSTVSIGYISLKHSISNGPKKPSIADKAAATFCNAKPERIYSEVQDKRKYDLHSFVFVPKPCHKNQEKQDKCNQVTKQKLEFDMSIFSIPDTIISENSKSDFNSTSSKLSSKSLFLDTQYPLDRKSIDAEMSSLLVPSQPGSHFRKVFHDDSKDDTNKSKSLDSDDMLKSNNSTVLLEYHLSDIF